MAISLASQSYKLLGSHLQDASRLLRATDGFSQMIKSSMATWANPVRLASPISCFVSLCASNKRLLVSLIQTETVICVFLSNTCSLKRRQNQRERISVYTGCFRCEKRSRCSRRNHFCLSTLLVGNGVTETAVLCVRVMSH